MSEDSAAGSDELAALRSICPDLRVIEEGGARYIFLPGLAFFSAGGEFSMDAILVPQLVAALGGYTTRLLLKKRTPKALSWTTVTALGGAWETWSWNDVPADAPLIEILANHLKALQ